MLLDVETMKDSIKSRPNQWDAGMPVGMLVLVLLQPGNAEALLHNNKTGQSSQNPRRRSRAEVDGQMAANLKRVRGQLVVRVADRRSREPAVRSGDSSSEDGEEHQKPRGRKDLQNPDPEMTAGSMVWPQGGATYKV
ncbi:hypothetical protein ASPCADRAFT_129414 [Aspergillus carbonarius ITEM 5010]|uniref:Uncharacterized protein n=1 Tax=Aspergillus carbonarius (strain ITEM 5010) TaxID=602072 RepID=A0A1R3RPD8_ASPC5|nr:hypothetical protein ASPCADRAFT_129414 [Aspergillus carbonarius ITEM 5010]